jgi:hypothetical protein
MSLFKRTFGHERDAAGKTLDSLVFGCILVGVAIGLYAGWKAFLIVIACRSHLRRPLRFLPHSRPLARSLGRAYHSQPREGRIMPSKTFEGKDDAGLEKQIWDWKLTNPKIKESKRYPIEILPLNMTKPTTPNAKLVSSNLVSIRIDYEESN